MSRSILPPLLGLELVLTLLCCLGPERARTSDVIETLVVGALMVAAVLLCLRAWLGPLEWDERVIRRTTWPRWELAWDEIRAVDFRRSGHGGLLVALTGADGRTRTIPVTFYPKRSDDLVSAVVERTQPLWESRVATARSLGLTLQTGKASAAAAFLLVGAFAAMGGTTALLPTAPEDKGAGSAYAGLALVVLVLLWIGWRLRLAWTRIDANGIEQYTGWRHRAVPWHAVKTLRLGRY